ncbi:MAG: hypothetical protein GYA24_18360 [Candidatus Lokiarchaeota archaeon]|nr:hypothetical protein [Candidatus Lokiarchaeota archaeon]
MDYLPMDPGSFPILPTYIGVAAFCAAITAMLFKKWHERRTRAPMLLFIAFLSYLVCIIVLTIGFAEVVVTGHKMELYKFSLAFGYAGFMVSHGFYITFAAELFSFEKRAVHRYIAVCLAVAVLSALPWNHYGLSADMYSDFHLRPYSMASIMIVTLVVGARIGYQAFKVSRHLDDQVGKIGFAFIGWSQILLIAFFLFMGIDIIIVGLTPSQGYTPFNLAGWLAAALLFFFSYIGLIMPGWLKRRISTNVIEETTGASKDS